MCFSEGASLPSTPAQIWGAFRDWASCHLYKRDGKRLITYTDLGFRLLHKSDVFQLSKRAHRAQVEYWSVQLLSRFVADTVVLEVPMSHLGLAEFGLEQKFDRRRPVIMVLRRPA